MRKIFLNYSSGIFLRERERSLADSRIQRMTKCNKIPAQRAGFKFFKIFRFHWGVFQDRSEFKSILKAEETGWTVKHDMDYQAFVITDIPLSTIEWE